MIERQAKALISLGVCAGQSEPLLVAHITLLEISCHGSYMSELVGCSFSRICAVTLNKHAQLSSECRRQHCGMYKGLDERSGIHYSLKFLPIIISLKFWVIH